MVNLGNWGVWGSSSPSNNWVIASGSDTAVAATACATRVFFLRVWGKLCCSSPPQWHFCCLSSALYIHFAWWALRQGPNLDLQGLGHHIYSSPEVSLLCLHRYNTRRKGIYGLCVLSDNHFIVFTWAGLSCSLAVLHCGCSPLHWQEMGHPGICPWHCQGIYLPLLHNIDNMAESWGS